MKHFQLASPKGILGEALAKRYLRARGHQILCENYYYAKGRRSGEIDLITLHEGKIRFIEVKTRYAKAAFQEKIHTFPIEAQVTRSKMQKCFKTAQHYLRTTYQGHVEYHFDVVTVYYDSVAKKAAIRYLPDVFY